MTASTDARQREFERAFPGGYFVDPADLDGLSEYLKRHGFLSEDESLRSARKAGEGNMNLTLRLVTSRRSLVLKQARPWVEKYPQIEAPGDRALVEIAFYEAAGTRRALRAAMPELVGSDPPSRILLLEDLGEAQDFTSLYAGAKLPEPDLEPLVSFLVTLHQPFGEELSEKKRLFLNREMRALNHEHIFRLPLAENNGLDLDGISPGLAQAAEPLKRDRDYVRAVTALGERYLEDGDHLVHGDYFPGSWLRTPDGIRVIDFEFCFLGEPAFDLGFLLGHFYLARQPPELGEKLQALYRDRSSGRDGRFDALVRGFAGAEVMRRLIGVAQLPLDYGTEERARLLSVSRELVLGR